MADTITGAINAAKTDSKTTVTPQAFVQNVVDQLAQQFPYSQEIQALSKLKTTSAPEFGNALSALPAQFQNEFLQALVNRISFTMIRDTELDNKLAPFKQGVNPLGSTIQEIGVNIAKGYTFDASKSANRLYQQTKPDVKEMFHITRRDMTYPLTIETPTMQQAFVSWDTFDKMIAQLFRSVINANINDEFQAMKKLVSTAVDTGKIATVDILTPDVDSPQQLSTIQSQLINIKSKMQFPNSAYNNAGLTTSTAEKDIQIIVTADLEAQFNADFYARFFNESYKDLHVLVVDQFPDVWRYDQAHTVTADDFTNGWLSPDDYQVGDTIPVNTIASDGATDASKRLDGSRIGWIVGDISNWYQVWDQFAPQFIPQPNAAGRYVNYFYQVNQIISHSEMVNAVVGLFPSPTASVEFDSATKTVVVGASTTSKVTVLPTTASQSVTYSSTAPTIATVDHNGTITGLAAGTSVITATSNDGIVGTTVVTVTSAPSSSSSSSGS